MKILTSCAIAFAMATPALGFAATPSGEGAPAVAVWAQDLDLSRPHDAKVLLQRIDDAALEACGGSLWSNPMERGEVLGSDCYKQGVGRAVASVNAPALNALYGARTVLASGDGRGPQ